MSSTMREEKNQFFRVDIIFFCTDLQRSLSELQAAVSHRRIEQIADIVYPRFLLCLLLRRPLFQ